MNKVNLPEFSVRNCLTIISGCNERRRERDRFKGKEKQWEKRGEMGQWEERERDKREGKVRDRERGTLPLLPALFVP